MTGGMSPHRPQAPQRAARKEAVTVEFDAVTNGPTVVGVFAFPIRLSTRRRQRSSGLSGKSKAIFPARCIAYSAGICMRMKGTIRSNQTAYSSRLSSSLASYSAPRTRMASAFVRCASRNAFVSRTRFSNFFGLEMARSSNSAACPQRAGEGGAADAGRSGTVSPMMNSYCDAPRRQLRMSARIAHSRKRRASHSVVNAGYISSTFAAASRPKHEQRRLTIRASTTRCAASCRLNSGPNPAGDRGAVEFAPRPGSADLFAITAKRAGRIRITVNEAGHGTLRPPG